MSDLKIGVCLFAAFFVLFCAMFAGWENHPGEQNVNGVEYLQSLEVYR